MRTLAEIRKDYVVLDPLSMTRKFNEYMGEVAGKFDEVTAAMREVVALLEQIEKNTRPISFPTHSTHSVDPGGNNHSLSPVNPYFPRIVP